MENSENTKKIVIVILVILILLGIIMMTKLIKKDETPENKISNNNNINNTIKLTDNNNIDMENTTDNNTTTVDNTVVVNEVEETNNQYIPETSKEIVFKNNSTGSNKNTNHTSENKNNIEQERNIDTTSPILDVKYSIEEKTNQDVIVTIKSNERLQNIEGWSLSSDGLTLTKTYSNNTTEEIYIKDLSGNITTVYINIENIDKIGPKVELIYSITSYTNKDVEAKITADKELQTVEGWTLSENKLELVKKYSDNINEDIKVRDIAGNEVIVNVSINNIDKIKPENAKVSNTLFLTKQIKTQLTLEDKISGIDLNKSYYKIDSSKEMSNDYSTFTKITNTNIEIQKNVEKDGTYYLHVISTDKVGNITKNTIELKVDTVKPKVTIEYSNKNWTKDNVTVTVTANKEMKEVKGWTLSKDKKVFTKTYSKNAEEEVIFSDLLDRTVVAKISINNIDKTSPEEPSLSKTIFNSKPIDNSKNIDIDLSAIIKDNKNGSGLNLSKCKYLLNKSNNKVNDFSSANTFTKETQTLHFTIKENSTYYLHILLTDNVGNTKYTTHTIISDTLNPIVTREYNIKDMTNQNVIVTVKSNEVLQGKEGWEVFDGGLTLRKEYDKNVSRIVETFYDLAGNPVGIDIKITNIDKVAPNEATISKTEFNTNNITLRVGLSDDYSGIDIEKCKYILDSNKNSNYASADTFSKTTEDLSLNVDKDGLYYLHILSVDKAGNETDTVKEIKVDTTNPEYKVTYSKTSQTNEDVDVTITANEELKNVSGWTLSNDKKTLTKTFNSNIDTTVTISDLLGNTSDVKIEISNIDKVTPKATVNYSTTTQTSEAVTVTIAANEQIVSTEGWSLSSDGLKLTKTFSENATETVTVRDLAGNYTTVSVIVANII